MQLLQTWLSFNMAHVAEYNSGLAWLALFCSIACGQKYLWWGNVCVKAGGFLGHVRLHPPPCHHVIFWHTPRFEIPSNQGKRMKNLGPLNLERFLIFMNPLHDIDSFRFLTMDSSKVRPFPVPHGMIPITCHLSSKSSFGVHLPPRWWRHLCVL